MKRLFSFITILLLLTGCHTTFQASQPISQRFKQLHLELTHPYDDHFAYLLRHTLRAEKVELTQQAPTTLHILHNALTQSTYHTLSMANELKTLTYRASIELFNQKKRLTHPITFSTQRSMVLSNQQPLASEKEMAMMEEAMAYDIIMQITHYLRHFTSSTVS